MKNIGSRIFFMTIFTVGSNLPWPLLAFSQCFLFLLYRNYESRCSIYPIFIGHLKVLIQLHSSPEIIYDQYRSKLREFSIATNKLRYRVHIGYCVKAWIFFHDFKFQSNTMSDQFIQYPTKCETSFRQPNLQRGGITKLYFVCAWIIKPTW